MKQFLICISMLFCLSTIAYAGNDVPMTYQPKGSTHTGNRSMFNDCQSLTSLNLSGFDTSNVTDMNNMFCDCVALATIYGGNWSTGSVEDSLLMFYCCLMLVGGQGTTYDENHIDHTYARIDGGSSAPGYFSIAV